VINPFTEINWHPQRKELRSFGKIVMIGALIIAAIFYFAGIASPAAASIIAGAGILCGAISYSMPAIAKPLYCLWFVFGASVGIVVSNLLLLLFYYLILTPLALLLRIVFRRDALGLKRTSTWHDCEKVKDLKRYYKQY
jgi:hypothetical protein